MDIFCGVSLRSFCTLEHFLRPLKILHEMGVIGDTNASGGHRLILQCVQDLPWELLRAPKRPHKGAPL